MVVPFSDFETITLCHQAAMKREAGKFTHLVAREQEPWSDGFCFLCKSEAQSLAESEKKSRKSAV